MRKKSFSIALSALACALAAVFMGLAINIPVLTLSGYVIASAALMLPLAKDFRLGGFLAYLATCLLCLAFGGIAYFYRLFPFVAFFGLHPLVNVLLKRRRIGRWPAWIFKAVWFDAMLCCTVLLMAAASIDIVLPFGWHSGWIYPIVIVSGTLVFLPYDWLMLRFQNFADYYIQKLDKGRPSSGGGENTRERGDSDDVFGADPLEGIGGEPSEGTGGEPRGGTENEKKDPVETGEKDGGEGQDKDGQQG